MATLKDLKRFHDELPDLGVKMPVYFFGHGSPMNGIEENEFSAKWAAIGSQMEPPSAVLCISAHWLTEGTLVTAMEQPKTIHDFSGFPKALFDVSYPAPGHPGLAKQTSKIISSTAVGLDHEWGLDHGTWSVVRKMFPNADVPVLQLSIDYGRPASYHYALAKELSSLRKKGVLIIGSGNMVHNLRVMNWKLPDAGYDWAMEMNGTFKSLIQQNDHGPLLNYQQLGEAAKLAIPTPDHYYPLMYSLGLQEKSDSVEIFNDKTVMGSVSMTSLRIS